MTRIIKLSMKGFKSFADRTDLLFGEKFNSILGPNGSGKSNVLDSLCFVLGKGSAKGLRAEKSANLIYNGGKTKNPAKEGEVSIYFDNKTKEFPLSKRFGMKGVVDHAPQDENDYAEEIKISRIITSSGQSKYKINDKTVTRQQILDLLSIARIDPDGYNIVLQGDIVRIVEMSPVERRGIIEEISGISIYEDKKQKALSTLEKVESKVNDAELILSERENYLTELKSDRDTAMKYKKLKDKIDSNKATYLDIQIKKKKNQIEAFDKHMTENEDKIKKLNETLNVLKSDLAERQKVVDEIQKEVEEKGEKTQIDIHKQVENLKVSIASNDNRIVTCKTEIERISTRKGQLEETLKEIENKIKALTAEKTGFIKEIENNKKEIEGIGAKIEEFKKKNKIEDSDNIEKEIIEIDQNSEESQKSVMSLRERQQDLLREKDKIEYKLENIDVQIEKVLEIEKANKAELEKLKQIRAEFKKATLELNKLLNEDSSLAAQASNARNQLMIANEELSKIKAKSISLEAVLGSNQGIKAILDNKSKFGEVYGLVSEIGKVQSKYSLALEIAAGAKLKSIVVKDDSVASRCIKFLKEKRLGIASFLPLNKIRPVPENPGVKKLTSAGGVHGMAIDLVSYETKFKNVFSFVFGNSLIVDSIDVARRIGIGKAKMVTLDGDVADVSGAMQGGYRKRHRSGIGFSEKEVEDQKQKFEAEVAELSSLVSNIAQKREDNESEITRLREFKATLEGEIIKMEKSLHLDSADLEANRKQRGLLEEELKIIDNKVNEIQNEISTVNTELARFKIKKAELRAKITQLKNPRLLAELNSFEQKKADLGAKIHDYTAKTASISTQLDSILLPERENTGKILKQNEKEFGDFSEEIVGLEKQIKLQKADLQTKEKEEKKFYQQFKNLFNKRNKLNDEIRDIDKKMLSSEEKIRETEQKNNFTSVEGSRVKAELMTHKEEFEKYKDAALLKDKSEPQLKKEIGDFEKMMNNMGNVNMRALEVYDNVEKEYHSLMAKKEKLKVEKDDVMMLINEIETKKNELFLKTYKVIVDKFTSIFNMLTTKDRVAEMILDNPENPLDGGLQIRVRITGKKFLDIKSLSGGEKTMTALAFLFAVQEHDPASFYILDEVDAALDKHNSEKLAKLIRKYSDNAQYIIISHNDAIISEADNLYGVSMNEHGMTKVTSLKI